ncbi:MAG: DUF4124 domain-containing protein [Haliea sp.]|nr:MAG: DUF4124 domain-containing protein [Haliea sp.]
MAVAVLSPGCLARAAPLQSGPSTPLTFPMRLNSLSLLIALGFSSGTLQAQVFRCQDASGKTAYQETPCSSAQANQNQRVLRISSQAAAPAPAASGAAGPVDGKAPAERGAFTLFYDPSNAPARYPPAAVEEVIAYAAQIWGERCLVDIKYGGQAVYWPVGTRQRVSIRWQTGYVDRVHPTAFNSMTTGTGSLATGIQLSPTIRELRALFVHELGHVLGIGHLHGDSEAIMGYLRHTGGTLSARPAPIDYLACNLAMKQSFGVPFDASPEDVARVEAALRMSDRRAVEKLDAARR